jgi:hypothetical protein
MNADKLGAELALLDIAASPRVGSQRAFTVAVAGEELDSYPAAVGKTMMRSLYLFLSVVK